MQIEKSIVAHIHSIYCAHGVCPVLISKRYEPGDGVVAGNHYLAGLPVGTIQHSLIQNIGSAAWDWYQPHRVMAHVDTLKRLLKDAGTAC